MKPEPNTVAWSDGSDGMESSATSRKVSHTIYLHGGRGHSITPAEGGNQGGFVADETKAMADDDVHSNKS